MLAFLTWLHHLMALLLLKEIMGEWLKLRILRLVKLHKPQNGLLHSNAASNGSMSVGWMRLRRNEIQGI